MAGCVCVCVCVPATDIALRSNEMFIRNVIPPLLKSGARIRLRRTTAVPCHPSFFLLPGQRARMTGGGMFFSVHERITRVKMRCG